MTDRIWLKSYPPGIVADIETIRAKDINDAYERMLRGDVKYRFVIDCASLDS